ncbi:MAG: type IV secretory system conjugative DNA transfer family protein, partial [Lachnospiraceae bacterium]|nr:type IV secretory system conjugative DNA transfer family protein [Lachnospiraceae bacterium]
MKSTGDMITKRTLPWSVYIIFLILLEVVGLYFSSCFLYENVNIRNFGELIIKGCTENYFLPWRIWNPMTPKCMGTALMSWILLSSYMVNHFRNWQSGMEHGAEDWGDPFEVTKRRANREEAKNRVLSRNLRIDTVGDRRPSNNNMLVIGSSGTYKTTSIVTPNLLLANENYIVLDVKGELSYKYALFLKSRGYTIRILDLKEQTRSDCYNPFEYIENENDLIKLIANIQDACTPPDSMSADPFWRQGAGLYLQSVFYYEWCVSKKEGRKGTFNNVLLLLNEETIPDFSVEPEQGRPQPSVLEMKMKRLEKEEGPDNPAVRDYRKLKEGAAETVRSIVIIINAMLKLCQTDGLKRIFSKDELNLREFATGVGGSVETPNLSGKIALFIIVNDEDDSFNFIASMLYTQALEILSRMADTVFKDKGGALPIPLTFWMDEFYAGARPHDTEKIMGVIRSRNISMVPILQSVAQIKALFKTEKWEVIMDNCPTLVFLGAGAGAIETHKYISELLGSMTIDTIGDGRHGKQWNANFGKAGAPL